MPLFTIETQYNTEEETRNFGPRATCETNGSIYESTTTATIQFDEETLQNPKVVTTIEYSKPCLAINNSIAIFEDEQYEKVVAKCDFDEDILSYCLSSDGQFLFVNLINGTLYCIYLIQFSVIFTRTIEKSIIKTFTNENTKKIYFVSSDTSVFRLLNFDQEKLSILVKQKNFDEFVSKISVEKVYTGIKNDKVLNVEYGIFGEHITIAMICHNNTYLWFNNAENNILTLPCHYKSIQKVQFLEDCRYILCLSMDMSLYLMCCETLIQIKIYNEPVFDFTIVRDQNQELNQICMLMKSKHDSDKLNLLTLAFPDISPVINIPVSKTTYLVQTIGCYMNNFVYLEGTETEISKKILIKTLNEGDPNMRLERLIKRGNFDEAMNFAKTYGLNKTLIYHAKASLLVSRINPWFKNNDRDEDLKNLLDILSKIEDVNFVFECCTKILLMDYKKMREIFIYAKNRIIQKSQDQNCSKLLTKINDILKQWDIFEVLKFNKYNDDGYSEENYSNDWAKFSNANMFEECIRYIEMGQIEEASIIWSKGFSSITENLSTFEVQRILYKIGQATPVQIEMWLHHFIPTILSLHPDMLPDIIIWVYEKVFSMETFIKPWPEVAIEFIQNFIHLLNLNNQRLFFQVNSYSSDDSLLQNLVLLSQSLKDLKKLRDEHRLIVPLEIYTNNPETVAHILLNDVKIENILQFIDKFLRKYLKDHFLDYDEVLGNYIQKILYASQDWWVWEEAPWEKRLSILVTLFNDSEKQLKYTLKMLKKAPVPLSSTMVSVVETSYKHDHEFVFEIKKEMNLISKKILCKKYGYQEMGICEEFIYFIIKQENNDAINDIFKLTENNEDLQTNAIIFYMKFYFTKGDVEKAFSILDSFDNDTVQYCLEWIINYTKKCIKLKFQNIEHWIKGLDFAERKLHRLLTKSTKNYSFSQTAKLIYNLQKEFNISILSTNLESEKEKVLRDYAISLSNGIAKTLISPSAAYENILKISNLFSVTPVILINLLYKNTEDKFFLTKFMHDEMKYEFLLRPENCIVFEYCKLILNLMLNDLKDEKLKMIVETLAFQLLDICSNDDLIQIVNLIPWVNRYSTIDVTDETYEIKVKNKKWNLSPVFTDAAVSSHDFISFFRKIFRIFVFYLEKKFSECQISSEQIKEDLIQDWLQQLPSEIEKLKSESHELSLTILLRCFYQENLINQIDSNLVQKIRSLMTSSSQTLFEKVIRSSRMDFYTGLACLFALPEVDKFMRTFDSKLKISKALLEIIHEYELLTDYNLSLYGELNFGMGNQFAELRLLQQWVPRLSKYSVTPKDILDNDESERSKLLKSVITNFVGTEENIHDFLHLIKDFCADFILDVQYYFMFCLDSLLKNWKPVFEIITQNGKKEINVNEVKRKMLEDRCKFVAHNISNKDYLKNNLRALKSQINYYYYEVFLIISDILVETDMKDYNYLLFLKQYTRVGKLFAEEEKLWEEINEEGCKLPAIAKYRLPYLATKNIDLFKETELNLKTYKQWLCILSSLSLDINNICSLAIKVSINEISGTYVSKNEINLWTENSVFIEDIKSCIECMSGPMSYELSTSALYYAMNKLPTGADKVAIAKECYFRAQLWGQQSLKSLNNNEKKIEKIRDQYYRLTAEKILQTYGLREKIYLEFINKSKTKELIVELYKHESIPRRYTSSILFQPDINAAVNDLSELFQKAEKDQFLMKIHLELLKEWLQSNSAEFQNDETENITNYVKKISESKEALISEDNLLRACYIIKAEIQRNGNEMIKMLSYIGFGVKNNDEYSFSDRYRALRILQITIDEKHLQELTKRDKRDFRKHLKSLFYLSELENLGLKYTADRFDSSPKNELIQLLIKRYENNQNALYLCFELCIDYDIYDILVWKRLLEQMKKISMVSQLKKVLPKIVNKSKLIYLEEYISCWQLIVDKTFNKLGIPPTEEQIDECIEMLKVLQVCPMIYDLNFEDSLISFFQSYQPWFAASLIPFLSDDKKKKIVSKISSHYNVQDIQNELRKLSLKGVISASIVTKSNFFNLK